jgi:hypothetical protein
MSVSGRSLLVVWLVLQLLLSQQFALAHHVSHVAESIVAHAIATPSTMTDGGEGESAAHVLSHTCTTCLAGWCISVALANSPLALHSMGSASALVASTVLPAPTFDRPLAFRTRAPPVLQD